MSVPMPHTIARRRLALRSIASAGVVSGPIPPKKQAPRLGRQHSPMRGERVKEDLVDDPMYGQGHGRGITRKIVAAERHLRPAGGRKTTGIHVSLNSRLQRGG